MTPTCEWHAEEWPCHIECGRCGIPCAEHAIPAGQEVQVTSQRGGHGMSGAWGDRSIRFWGCPDWEEPS